MPSRRETLSSSLAICHVVLARRSLDGVHDHPYSPLQRDVECRTTDIKERRPLILECGRRRYQTYRRLSTPQIKIAIANFQINEPHHIDMETVLVVGATGNIGVSAVKAALNSNRNVLAIVRNPQSADKLMKNLDQVSTDRISFAVADVLSDSGVRGVVEQVKDGKLPSFQHVYTCGRSRLISLMRCLIVRRCLTGRPNSWR